MMSKLAAVAAAVLSAGLFQYARSVHAEVMAGDLPPGGSPSGIQYKWQIYLDDCGTPAAESVTGIVGSRAWADPEIDPPNPNDPYAPRGWTHTSNWIYLHKSCDGPVTVELGRPLENCPAPCDLVPAFSLWDGTDTVGFDHHTFEQGIWTDGEGVAHYAPAWVDDPSFRFLDFADPGSNPAVVTLWLNAGNYTLNVGGHDDSQDGHGVSYVLSVEAEAGATAAGNDVIAGFAGGAEGLWSLKHQPVHTEPGEPHGAAVSAAEEDWVRIDGGVPQQMLAADVNGNGSDDVIITQGAKRRLKVWLDDAGWIAWPFPFKGALAEGLRAGRLDNGVKADAAAVFEGSDDLWAYMNNQAWTNIEAPLAGHPELLALGNVRGKAREDVIVAIGAKRRLRIWMDNRKWVSWPSPEGALAQRMVLGDLDGNGLQDAVTDFGAAGLYVRMNAVQPSESEWVKIDPKSPRLMVSGDVDNDGRDDVIAFFRKADDFLKVRLDSNEWIEWDLPPAAGTPTILSVADIDHNGLHDVLAGDANALWARMNGRDWVELRAARPKIVAGGNIDGE